MQPQETSQSISGPGFHRVAPWVVLAGIVAGYFALVLRSARNLPTYDDYGIIGFIARVHLGEFSWGEFWQPHNEHRIVWTRLVMLAASSVGKVNFVGLMIVGNLGWLGCGWLLGREAARRAGSLWAAVPVVALLAVPSHQENMLWAMASLQNYWVLFFVLLALKFSAEGRDGAAVGLFAAALLTSGAAVAALPGLFLLPLLRREWRKVALVAIAGLVLVGGYVVGLKTQSDLHATGAREIVRYFANFMGGTVPWPGLAVGMGAGLAVVMLLLVARFKVDGFCAAVAAFVLITAGLASVARGGFGVEQALASRYAVYSLLAAAIAWLACLGRARPLVVRAGGILLVLGAAVATGEIFHSGRWERYCAGIPMEYYKVTSRFPSHVGLMQYLELTQRAGIYQPPPLAAVSGRLPARRLPGDFAAPAAVESWVDHYDGSYVNGWARQHGRTSLGQVVWIMLRNEQHEAWAVPAWSFDRPDLVAADHNNRDSLQSGFEMALPLFALPAGRYDLSLLVWQDGIWAMAATPFTYGVGVPKSELKLRD